MAKLKHTVLGEARFPPRPCGLNGMGMTLGISLFGLTLLGCTPAGPRLERFDEANSAWVELGPLVLESMTGERAGSQVRATAAFVDGDDRITLSMELFLEPPARFVSGTHRSRIGGQSFGGPISSQSVTFFGGQNEGPSVGGVFLFENVDNRDRYRIRFPATAFERSLSPL